MCLQREMEEGTLYWCTCAVCSTITKHVIERGCSNRRGIKKGRMQSGLLCDGSNCCIRDRGSGNIVVAVGKVNWWSMKACCGGSLLISRGDGLTNKDNCL